MEVLYRSTRGTSGTVTASQAILKGLSEDGGLYVPTRIPALDIPVEELADMSYQEVAYQVMSRFFTDFTEEELQRRVRISWNCFMGLPLLSKIWLCPFFPICSPQPLPKIR